MPAMSTTSDPVAVGALRYVGEQCRQAAIEHPDLGHIMIMGAAGPLPDDGIELDGRKFDVVGGWRSWEYTKRFEGYYFDSEPGTTALCRFRVLATSAWLCAVSVRGPEWGRPLEHAGAPDQRWLLMLHAAGWKGEHPLIHAPRMTGLPGLPEMSVEGVTRLQSQLRKPGADAKKTLALFIASRIEDPEACWWSVLEPGLFEATALAIQALLDDRTPHAWPGHGPERWYDAAWYNKHTDGALYAALLRRALMDRRVTARKVGSRNHYELASVLKAYPQYADHLRNDEA